MTQEDDEHYKNADVCRFFEKNFECDKIRYHCRLTGKYRRPDHNTCNIIVEQKQSSFIPFVFHSFCNYECHLFFKS